MHACGLIDKSITGKKEGGEKSASILQEPTRWVVYDGGDSSS